MNIIEVKRDKVCNYCACSEYREDFDNRKFFELRPSDRRTNAMIIRMCENCVKDLKDDLITLFDTKG